MIRRTFLAKVIAAVAFTVALSNPSQADPLGVASGYNLFVFTDLERYNTDSEGRVAVGGNATLSSYGINDRNPGDGPGVNAFVVGGNLTYNGGQVFYGDTKVGGTVSGSFGSPNGTVSSGLGSGGLPFSFASAITDLTNRSSYWGGLAANGTSNKTPWGQLTLTGTDSGLNVFSIDGATLSGLTELRINAPGSSTAIVNVTGNPGNFSNYGMFLEGGLTRHNVLFNFLDATELNVSGFGFKGSVLAPYATLNHSNGNMEGTIIVNRVSNGNGEFHTYPFGGTPPTPPGGGGDPPPPPPPPPAAVPAPPGLVLGLIGAAMGLGLYRRRKE